MGREAEREEAGGEREGAIEEVFACVLLAQNTLGRKGCVDDVIGCPRTERETEKGRAWKKEEGESEKAKERIRVRKRLKIYRKYPKKKQRTPR